MFMLINIRELVLYFHYLRSEQDRLKSYDRSICFGVVYSLFLVENPSATYHFATQGRSTTSQVLFSQCAANSVFIAKKDKLIINCCKSVILLKRACRSSTVNSLLRLLLYTRDYDLTKRTYLSIRKQEILQRYVHQIRMAVNHCSNFRNTTLN